MSASSPITARVTIDSKIVGLTEKSSRYALDSIAVIPVRQMETVKVGTTAKYEAITERRPVNEVYCVATNAKGLVIRKQFGLASREALLPGALAKPSTKSKVNTVSLNGRWESTLGTMAEERQERFPRVKDVVTEFPVDSHVITLDAELLLKIAQAVGDGKNATVNIIIDPNSPGMVGISANDDGSTAAIGLLCAARSESDTTEKPGVVQDYNRKVNAFVTNDAGAESDEWGEKVVAILNPVTDPQNAPVAEMSTPGYMMRVGAVVRSQAESTVCLFDCGKGTFEAYGNCAEIVSAQLGVTMQKWEREAGYSVDMVTAYNSTIGELSAKLKLQGYDVAVITDF